MPTVTCLDLTHLSDTARIKFALRRATNLDRPFLYQLKCLTLRPLIEVIWGWDEGFQQLDFAQRFAAYEICRQHAQHITL